MYETAHEVPVTQTSKVSSIGSDMCINFILFSLQGAPQSDINEDIYMVPATDKHTLYSQFSRIRINNFTRNSIKSVDCKFNNIIAIDTQSGAIDRFISPPNVG